MDVADVSSAWMEVDDLPGGAVDGVVRPQFLACCSVIRREIDGALMNGEVGRSTVARPWIDICDFPNGMVGTVVGPQFEVRPVGGVHVDSRTDEGEIAWETGG